jgi:hypothetical protein
VARHAGMGAWLLVVGAAVGGCGPQVGALGYFFAPHPKQTIPAKFKLTTGPLLILVDDSPSLDTPPDFDRYVVQALSEEFGTRDINKNVVPAARVREMRREHNNFETNDGLPRGIREVGQLFDAEQVLWVQPKEFAMSDTPITALDPARLTVALKVINAKAEHRDELRLWPTSEEGELVTIQIKPQDVRKTKSPDELLKRMTQALAGKIGLLFRDHQLTAEDSRPS